MCKKLTAISIIVVFSVSLVGCATTNPDGSASPGRSTVGGAVAGALAGAALGALAGLIPGGNLAANVARGAIIGAGAGLVAGAVAGFAYGKYQEQLYRDRQAAEAYHQYNTEQGEKVIIEAVEVQPDSSSPGGSVAMNSVFSVLTGNMDPVPVEITQIVMVGDKICGQPFCLKQERVSGTYKFSVPMQIPANAPDGKYKLMTAVKTSKSTDQKLCEFLVAKKASPEEKPEPEVQQPTADKEARLPCPTAGGTS